MITVLLFHNISANASSANHYTQYSLIKMLASRGVLHQVICLSSGEAVDIPPEKIIEVKDNYVFKISNYLFSSIKKVWKRFNSRYYQEIMFDRICWSYISASNIQCVYSSKPLFTYTFNKCIERGIITINRVSIAHPLFNYYLIKNEEIKWNLISSGSYSDIKRSLRISQGLHQCSKILINYSQGDNEFLYKTYAQCLSQNKLIRYKNMYISPRLSSRPKVNLKSEQITFIHVAYMNLIKGTHYLIEAWKKFQPINNRNAKLILIGRMDTNISLMYPPSEVIKIPNLEYKGYVKDPFIKFQTADAFVSSSLSEAGPATMIEALSMGIPVIASNNCGLSNLIQDYENGFKYDFHDMDRLVDIFNWFINNPSSIYQMKEKAFDTSARYTEQAYQLELWESLKKAAPNLG